MKVANVSNISSEGRDVVASIPFHRAAGPVCVVRGDGRGFVLCDLPPVIFRTAN
jgi:hypothetical protein